MTIAACYVVSEGVVFGADSTTTIVVSEPTTQECRAHHYTFGQKIFEFGESGLPVGIVTWGLGSLGSISYRTLFAEAADLARTQNLPSLDDLANLWARTFWTEYTRAFEGQLVRAQAIAAKGPAQTQEEHQELESCRMNYSGGFCFGGRWGQNRRPRALEILFDPLMTDAPTPQPLALGNPKFWGCPNLISRLILGIDRNLFQAILSSGKWTGTPDELLGVVRRGVLGAPRDLPIREAIDLVYAYIFTTIKAMKFSHLAPVCGGPIEIAVVTTDRPFRWVHHKEMYTAISEGGFRRGNT